MEQTTVTEKFQTTIPKNIRKFLAVKKGNKVDWHVIRNIVVVDSAKPMKEPVKFLTGQIKLDLDMVDLVNEVREER